MCRWLTVKRGEVREHSCGRGFREVASDREAPSHRGSRLQRTPPCCGGLSTAIAHASRSLQPSINEPGADSPRRVHSASITRTRTRTPNRSHRSQLRSRSRCPCRSQFCRQQRAASDANTAARCGARSAAICAAQTQPFSNSRHIGKTGSRDEEDSHSPTVCFLQHDTRGWQRKWQRKWLQQARADGIRKGCVGRSATGGTEGISLAAQCVEREREREHERKRHQPQGQNGCR